LPPMKHEISLRKDSQSQGPQLTRDLWGSQSHLIDLVHIFLDPEIDGSLNCGH